MTSNHEARRLARIANRAERDAWAESFELAPRDVKDALGIAVHALGSARVIVMAALDVPLFNRALGLGIDGAASETDVDRVVEIFRDAGIERFAVSLSDHVEPDDLGARLERRGLAPGFRFAKMVRGTEPPPDLTTDLRIERIGRDRFDDYARVLAEGFEMPEPIGPLFAGSIGDPAWRHYVAYDDDVPVATSAIHVRDRVAWCGMMTTLASHRGRGVQGAMFARRIRDGLELGCEWFVTETGEQTPERPNPSFRNMLRAGFEIVELRPDYGPA